MTRPSPADIFARHHHDVYRYLVRMTGRRDVADDLAQEVFLRVVRASANGGPVGHERGWIFSIARHLVADRWRDAQREVVPGDNRSEPAHEESPGLAIDLARSLARLAEEDRDVFLLKEVGGLSYDEIARACDCSVESVRARLRRTRVALRAMLSL